MSAGKSIRKLQSRSDSCVCRHRPALKALCEALTFQKLEDDVLSTVLDSDVMDNTDVRVLQCRARSSLSQHLVSRVALRDRIVKDFEGHITPQANV
jgi:hypothetical protein